MNESEIKSTLNFVKMLIQKPNFDQLLIKKNGNELEITTSLKSTLQPVVEKPKVEHVEVATPDPEVI
jgi:hypothetical protein